jgi:SAM-dependent methyltransferase
VLHHLDLEKAYRELARVLKPEGQAICTEALRHNVCIHAYRRLTPHLRSAWETDHILGRKEIGMARSYFGRVEVLRFFHLATILAIPFRRRRFFDSLRKSLEVVDRGLLTLPVLRWQAWMAVFVLGRARRGSGREIG